MRLGHRLGGTATGGAGGGLTGRAGDGGGDPLVGAEAPGAD